MIWQIKIDDNSKKQLAKLDKQSQKIIAAYLRKIFKAGHPKQFGKPLKHNFKGLWRYRVNKFRIVCHIKNEELIVIVLRIAKRDIIYDD